MRAGGRPGQSDRSGNDPVIGAPVFLESIDAESHKRLKELAGTRTDARGTYQFTGLPPGTYRLLSTFDFDNPDVGNDGGRTGKDGDVEGRQSRACDLELLREVRLRTGVPKSFSPDQSRGPRRAHSVNRYR